MFGPGTTCRCATCAKLPAECQWGGGPYAGVLLLYLQEITLNKLWTQNERETQTTARLDLGTTNEKLGICEAALLHAMLVGLKIVKDLTFKYTGIMISHLANLHFSVVNMTTGIWLTSPSPTPEILRCTLPSNPPILDSIELFH